MEGEAVSAFDIAPKGSNVQVTWSMDGENGFMGKLFGLLMGMEDMIGSAYEDSLANLKTIAEDDAKKQAAVAAAEPVDAAEPIDVDADEPTEAE